MKFKSNKILIGTATKETANSIKYNPPRILEQILRDSYDIPERSYSVLTRFVSIQFQTDDEGNRGLEQAADIKDGSITKVTWLKDPKRRTPEQQFADLGGFRRNAETANQIIQGNGCVSILESTVCTHKEVKEMLTCKICQIYGPNAKRPTQHAHTAAINTRSTNVTTPRPPPVQRAARKNTRAATVNTRSVKPARWHPFPRGPKSTPRITQPMNDGHGEPITLLYHHAPP